MFNYLFSFLLKAFYPHSLETFSRDVAFAPIRSIVSLCRFSESAPKINDGQKPPNVHHPIHQYNRVVSFLEPFRF